MTPEKYFLKSSIKLHSEFPLPSNRLSDLPIPVMLEYDPVIFESASSPEVVLLMAPPASGKSTLSREFVTKHGCTRINQDELKSLASCAKAAKTALSKGESIIVDNTNLNPSTRSQWIALAKEMNVKVEGFLSLFFLSLFALFTSFGDA
jgi:bifunctional polynucleotide phosphatase/kinase